MAGTASHGVKDTSCTTRTGHCAGTARKTDKATTGALTRSHSHLNHVAPGAFADPRPESVMTLSLFTAGRLEPVPLFLAAIEEWRWEARQ